MIYTLTVRGKPQPKGSTRSFYNPNARNWLTGEKGVVVTTSANPNLKQWEALIRNELQDFPFDPVEGPVATMSRFMFQRPASKSEKRHPYMLTMPDVDKLLRGIHDAMNGIVFADDKQVVAAPPIKIYGPQSRADIVLAWGEDADDLVGWQLQGFDKFWEKGQLDAIV